NGLDISLSDIPLAMVIPVAGMAVGVCIAVFISYKKPKKYEDLEILGEENLEESTKSGIEAKLSHVGTLMALVAAFILQLIFDSMSIGSLGGIILMYITRVIGIREVDAAVRDGIIMMGTIAVIMLIASGYASILTESGAVE